jgi:hypothetical protein
MFSWRNRKWIVGIFLLGLVLGGFILKGCDCGDKYLSITYRCPRWTPDGRIVCIKEVEVIQERVGPMLTDEMWNVLKEETYITIMNADGTEEEDLWKVEWGNGQPVYSPSGEKIAYVGGKGFVIMDKEGNNKRSIKRRALGTLRSYDWSPDEKHLVYDAYGEIWVIVPYGLYSVFPL